MKRPNKDGKRVVPLSGGQMSESGETVGPPLYRIPMSEKITVVKPVPVDVWQFGEAVPEEVLDPDRPLVPTAKEFARLPHWAKVSFLTRCARRILSFSEHACFTQCSELQFVENTVSGVENAARTGVKDFVPEKVLTVFSENQIWTAAGFISKTAARIAREPELLDEAHLAIRLGATTILERSTVRTSRLIVQLRRDFDRLSSLAREHGWTDDTPVSPEVFGPLWPKGLIPRLPEKISEPPETHL